MNVLLFEPDPGPRNSLRAMLQNENMVVVEAEDHDDAVAMSELYSCSIAILDADTMPDPTGAATVRNFRRCKADLPVLILSSTDTVPSKVAALWAGADDYLAKPYHPAELVARVKALMRRGHGIADSTISFGDLVINLDAAIVTVRGKRLHLTAKEYRILEFLAQTRGRLITRDKIMDVIYGAAEEEPCTKIIDVFMCKVRRKLDAALPGQEFIQTIWGRGFIFTGGVPRDQTSPRRAIAGDASYAMA